MRRNLVILLILLLATFLVASCNDNKNASIAEIVSQWEGREILFPENSVFTIQGRDTVDFQFQDAPYKILTYVDSVGCMSCKLHLSAWKGFINLFDSVSKGMVSTVLYINAKKLDDITLITQRAAFVHPICFDINDELNALNGFPPYMEFQTFLLDKWNRVLLVGNPILNPEIRRDYLAILGGDIKTNTEKTMVEVDITEVDMGLLSYGKSTIHRFNFRNVGEHKLVLNDIISSCDCIKVQCDKLTAFPNEYIELTINFTSTEIGDFFKMVSVYCNTEDSPIELYIYGKVYCNNN